MNKKYYPLVVLGAALILLAIFWNSVTGTIDPAQRGVVFYKFGEGLDTENIYSEGFYFIAPWNKMHRINVQELSVEEKEMNVISSEGLSFTVDLTARYRPVPSRIGVLYQKFKGDHEISLVVPEVRSIVRTVIGKYTVEQLYASKRTEIEDLIASECRDKLIANDIEIKAVLVRAINLPERIKEAIKLKEEEKQKAETMEFKLKREESEAKRLIIEATGQAEANRIVTESINSNLLKWKGVEATLKLAESPNSKVVVIGGGDGGLPIILNDK